MTGAARVPGLLVRDATEVDLPAITEIYNWTIVDNHVSFDTEPFDAARRQAWWEARRRGTPWPEHGPREGASRSGATERDNEWEARRRGTPWPEHGPREGASRSGATERDNEWEARRRGTPWPECLVAEVDGGVIGVAYSSWFRPKAAYRSSMETTIVLDVAHTGRGVGTELLSALCRRLAAGGVHRAIAIVALPNPASIALHHKLGYRTVGVLNEVGEKLGRYWDTEILEKDLSSPQR